VGGDPDRTSFELQLNSETAVWLYETARFRVHCEQQHQSRCPRRKVQSTAELAQDSGGPTCGRASAATNAVFLNGLMKPLLSYGVAFGDVTADLRLGGRFPLEISLKGLGSDAQVSFAHEPHHGHHQSVDPLR
jgi:hypothetical protein